MTLCCRHDERVAVKIVRNIEKYHYAAKVEVDILSDLQKSDSPSKQWVMNSRCYWSSSYGRHLCLWPQKFLWWFDIMVQGLSQLMHQELHWLDIPLISPLLKENWAVLVFTRHPDQTAYPTGSSGTFAQGRCVLYLTLRSEKASCQLDGKKPMWFQRRKPIRLSWSKQISDQSRWLRHWASC